MDNLRKQLQLKREQRQAKETAFFKSVRGRIEYAKEVQEPKGKEVGNRIRQMVREQRARYEHEEQEENT